MSGGKKQYFILLATELCTNINLNYRYGKCTLGGWLRTFLAVRKTCFKQQEFNNNEGKPCVDCSVKERNAIQK